MPLQVSTILLQADQRQAASNPPLPPITKEQIEQGELASLLLEEDYNLSTMVDYLVVLINTCFHLLKLTLDHLNISKSDDCLNLSFCQYKNNDWSNFFHGSFTPHASFGATKLFKHEM